MVLIVLGLVLIIGILVYYIASTGSGKETEQHQDEHQGKKKKVSDDLRKEDNVIYLPNDNAKDDPGKDQSDN
jgi:anionic cell wall polymer biosynthesis LytR-Cps2A-Psr (LCP) family protein